MDPTNNSTPNPNTIPGANGASAMPNPVPVSPAPVRPPVAPAAPVVPTSPVASAPSATPIPPVAPTTPPVPPVAPVQPISTIPTQPASTTSVSNSASNSNMGSKVNPTIPVQSAAAASPVVNQNPVNPVFQPSGQNISATDPIMMPEPPKAVDPVEEELKAPMKAAAPVPGSIGSAVSGPEDGGMGADASSDIFNSSANDRTRNVSFNDPATQPNNPQSAKMMKNKSSKGALIALIIVFVIIAGVLAVVLLGQIGVLDLGNLFGSNKNNDVEVSDVTVDEPVTPEPSSQNTDTNTPTSKSTFLTCSRDMSETELLSYGDSLSGTIDIDTEFSNNKLISISLSKNVIYNIPDEITGQPTTEREEEALSSTVDNITIDNAADYYLTAGADGKIDFTAENIQANYQALDFNCKSL